MYFFKNIVIQNALLYTPLIRFHVNSIHNNIHKNCRKKLKIQLDGMKCNEIQWPSRQVKTLLCWNFMQYSFEIV